MNQQLKTVLLTVLTLSVFVIALVELSGVSSTALFNKYGIDMNNHHHDHRNESGAVMPSIAMPKTTIEFENNKHDFGIIEEGEVVKHAYKFVNTGDNPLVITNAVASCGCTVPSYPKAPIQPGEEGEVIVEFNSKGRVGHNEKNVMIYSNAQQDAMSVGFEAEVKEK